MNKREEKRKKGEEKRKEEKIAIKEKAESLLKGYHKSLGISEKAIDLNLKRSTITFIYSDDYKIGDYHMQFILMIDAFIIDRKYRIRFYFSKILYNKEIILSKDFNDIFNRSSLEPGDIIYFKDDKNAQLKFNKFIDERIR